MSNVVNDSPFQPEEARSIVKDALLDGFSFRFPWMKDPCFELHSGSRSSWLMETYRPFSQHKPLTALGQLAQHELVKAGVEYEAIGGRTLGSILLTFSTVLSEADDHKWFEINKDGNVSPPPLRLDRLVIAENTTTTGAEMFNAIDDLEALGCREIVAAMSVFDRSVGAVRRRFEQRGVPYIPLFTLEDDFPVIASFVGELEAQYPMLYQPVA